VELNNQISIVNLIDDDVLNDDVDDDDDDDDGDGDVEFEFKVDEDDENDKKFCCCCLKDIILKRYIPFITKCILLSSNTLCSIISATVPFCSFDGYKDVK